METNPLRDKLKESLARERAQERLQAEKEFEAQRPRREKLRTDRQRLLFEARLSILSDINSGKVPKFRVKKRKHAEWLGCCSTFGSLVDDDYDLWVAEKDYFREMGITLFVIIDETFWSFWTLTAPRTYITATVGYY